MFSHNAAHMYALVKGKIGMGIYLEFSLLIKKTKIPSDGTIQRRYPTYLEIPNHLLCHNTAKICYVGNKDFLTN